MKKYLIYIFLIAFCIRLIAIFNINATAPDSGQYLALAKNIITLHSYTLKGNIADDSRAPLYPFFLAFIIKFISNDLFIIKLIQIFLDSTSCIFIYLITFNIFQQRKNGIIASLLYAFHPIFIASTAFILSETLSIFLLLISFFFLSKPKEKNSKYIISAVFFALATLTRASTLLFPLFLLMLIIILSILKPQLINKKYINKFIIFFIFFLFTLSPWIIRNYIVFNRFIPISANLGGNLFIGSNQKWQGNYKPEIMKIRNNILKNFHHPFRGHYEIDDKLKTMALKTIRENPIQYILLCFRKMFFMLIKIPGSENILKNKLFIALPIYLYHYSILLLSIIGSINIIKYKNIQSINVIYIFSFILYIILLHAMLVALPRYLMPAIVFMIILASNVINSKWHYPIQPIGADRR